MIENFVLRFLRQITFHLSRDSNMKTKVFSFLLRVPHFTLFIRFCISFLRDPPDLGTPSESLVCRSQNDQFGTPILFSIGISMCFL